MEHVHRLHHRAVAAARRDTPSPPPALYNFLARGGPHPTASDGGLPFPTDPFPPFFGQAPSSIIAPFLPPGIPTIDPLSGGILPTMSDTPAPSKPTAGLSSNTDTTSPVETHTPAPVLKTTPSPVSHGASSTPSTTTTSGNSLPPQVPAVVTQVVPPSSSTSALSNNTSPSQASGATTNSGSVAAGVVVGLVGACAMVVFLVFLVRRKLSKSHDDFDATDFRRSAVLIHDPPGHEDDVARGYKPRPPTMIERKMANSPVIPAVTHGNIYNAPPEGYHNTASGPHNQAVLAGRQLSNSSGGPHTQVLFVGGQLMNPFVSAPPSPGSFATAGHSQSSNGVLVTPNAPHIMKPPPGPRRTSRPATGNDPGAANGFTFPQRQGSRPGTAERKQEQNVIPEQVPSDDYVDLSRSSVSPFQAAQYAAISRHLATDVPRGLDDVDVTSIVAPSSLEYIDEPPPVPPKSPFEDAVFVAVEPSTESTDDAPPPVPSKSPFEDPAPEYERENIQDPVRESYASQQTLTPELMDFPVPPSPALTLMSRHRVDSLPPTLPELKLDFGTQPLNTIKGNNAVPKYSSSPLAANNTIGDEVEEAGMSSRTNVPPVLSTTETAHKSRPDTVYDPADAYGGI